MASMPATSDISGLHPSAFAPVMTEALFCVRAALNVESLPRIVGLFAQRGIVPKQLTCRSAGTYLIVDLEIAVSDDAQVEILLQKLRAMVLVDRACIVGRQA